MLIAALRQAGCSNGRILCCTAIRGDHAGSRVRVHQYPHGVGVVGSFLYIHKSKKHRAMAQGERLGVESLRSFSLEGGAGETLL